MLCEKDVMTEKQARSFFEKEREDDDAFTLSTRHHLRCRGCGQTIESTIDEAAWSNWVVSFKDRKITSSWRPRCGSSLRQQLQTDYEEHLKRNN